MGSTHGQWGSFPEPEGDRFTYAQQRGQHCRLPICKCYLAGGCYRLCMCKCAETKREALDRVKPSWCHYSSDSHFLSLNLSFEQRRDKYTKTNLEYKKHNTSYC